MLTKILFCTSLFLLSTPLAYSMNPQSSSEDDGLMFKMDDVTTVPVATRPPLTPKSPGSFALYEAAGRGDLNEVKAILNQPESSVNTTTPNGATALHNAAAKGHLAVVECLVNHGADVKATTRIGNTPLSMAETFNHHAVMFYLTTKQGVSSSTKFSPAASATSTDTEERQQEAPSRDE